MLSRPRKSQKETRNGDSHVEAKLFERALYSYPDQFQRAPDVSFEQHLNQLMAAESATGLAHAAGK